MEVRTCRRCGKIFSYVEGQVLCPACKTEIEDSFQRVKDFVRDNPQANIQEIAKENGVTSKMIKQWVREERLEFTADSPVKFSCENCGAVISSGRYCENCKKKMANNFSAAYAPMAAAEPHLKKSGENGMRFLK